MQTPRASPILDLDDLDEVDYHLVSLTEFLDDIGVSRTQQLHVLRERQAAAYDIVDAMHDASADDEPAQIGPTIH